MSDHFAILNEYSVTQATLLPHKRNQINILVKYQGIRKSYTPAGVTRFYQDLVDFTTKSMTTSSAKPNDIVQFLPGDLIGHRMVRLETDRLNTVQLEEVYIRERTSETLKAFPSLLEISENLRIKLEPSIDRNPCRTLMHTHARG